MRIERAVNYLTSLGPGKRLCIWTNGCPRRCPGCVSERLRIPDEETEVDISEYLEDYNIEAADGVTVSGGEPFMQPSELLRLLRYLRERGASDILVYTGYTLEELRRMGSREVDEALGLISVLIDGPYVEKLDTGRGNLYGSTNQRVIYLDESQREKYEKYIRDERAPEEIIAGNTLISAGIPSREYIQKFKGE